jgi:hypothetical protein
MMSRSSQEISTKTIVLNEAVEFEGHAAGIVLNEPNSFEKIETEPSKLEDQSDVVPAYYLFKKNVIGIREITIAEKYIIAHAFHLNDEPKVNVFEWDVNTIVEDIKNIDFMTFNWKDIPKQVFIDIFSRMSFIRLIVFCAHYHIYLPCLDKETADIPKMILSLWKKFKEIK